MEAGVGIGVGARMDLSVIEHQSLISWTKVKV
jgi:hypothetical protein